MKLTAEILAEALQMPKARAAAKLPFLLEALALAGCADDPWRLSRYIGQTAHETGKYLYRKEIWGPTKQQLRYEPGTALAARLGNIKSGDGKRYMGRGDIQTTGRANYLMTTLEMRKLLPDCPDFVTVPDMLAEPRWGALAGALFWRRNTLNRFCDSRDDVLLTKRINGGTNGLAERLHYSNAVYARLI